MPSVFTHGFAGLAIARIATRKPRSAAFWIGAALLPMLPDADVLLLWGGFTDFNHGAWSHRAASHSFAFAAAESLAFLLLFMREELLSSARGGFGLWLLFTFMISTHGILDMFTNGGSDIMLLWPFTERRFDAPWHPIAVSPVSIRGFFTSTGYYVFKSELLWVWFPLACVLAADALTRLSGRKK